MAHDVHTLTTRWLKNDCSRFPEHSIAKLVAGHIMRRLVYRKAGHVFLAAILIDERNLSEK